MIERDQDQIAGAILLMALVAVCVLLYGIRLGVRHDHVRAKSAPWSNGVEIAAFGRLQNGDTKVATIQWETISECAEMKPLLLIRKEQAQVLMDDLWNAGIRPTEGAGSAGAMRAAEHHIADLRRVAFKALGIE